MPISSSLHLYMLLFVLAVVSGLCFWGARARRAGQVAQASRAIGGGMLGLWLLYNAYYFHPQVFAWETSLPLQICDLMALVAAVTLLLPSRALRSILFFTAFPLTSQAIITPAGNQDPSTLRFWLYWLLHAGILAISLFDLTARGYRPTGRDFVSVLIFDLVYVAMVFPLNVLFDWNYGYLGDSTPGSPTAIDLLGPWPTRAFLMIGIALAVQAAMLLLWWLWRGIRGRWPDGRRSP